MSGSTIGGVVGGAIGFVASGYSYQGFQIGYAIGSIVGGQVDPDVIKGPRINDSQIQTSNEGVPRPIVFGTYALAGNIIQRGELNHHTRRDRSGKGGGPIQETDFTTITLAIRIAKGPIGGVPRIWQDDKLVADLRDPAEWPEDAASIEAMRADTAAFMSKCRIYLGDETQMPDPALEALPVANGGGDGNVPAYRGTAYAVLDEIEAPGGRVPQFRWEVSACTAGTIVAGASARWYLTADDGSTGTGNDNVVWTADQLTGPWEGPFTRSATNPTETDLGVYDTGTSFLYIKTNSTHYEVSTDFNSDGNFITTAGTFPFDINRVVCLGAGQVIAINFDGTFTTDKYLVSVNGGQTWQERDFEPGVGGGRGLMDVQRIQTVSGQRLIATGINSADLRKFYYCDANDLGVSLFWTEAVMGPGVKAGNRIACTGAIAACLGANGASGTLSRTTTGDTWEVVGGATNWNAVGEACGWHQSFIFSASGFGNTLIVSTDSGDNWTETLVDYNARRFSSSDTEIVMSIDSNLVPETPKVSIDGGDTWADITTPSDGGASNETIARVGTYPIYTYTIPDAPDFSTDIDGNIGGPGMDRVAACSEVLSVIVTEICRLAGIREDQLEVSQLTDEIRGFMILQGPAGDALLPLQTARMFDLPEWDLKLRGIKRGGPVLFDFTDDDLVDVKEDDVNTRAQAVEFPRKLNLVASDPTANYDPVKETFSRRTENVKAVGESTFSLSIAMTRDEVAQTVDVLGKVTWTEAEGRDEFSLPIKFSKLTTTDRYTKDGHTWRAVRVENLDTSIRVNGVRDRVSTYTSNATGSTPVRRTDPVVNIGGPTYFTAMNLPSLRTQDNSPGMYVAARGFPNFPGWRGARLQISIDGGLTYNTVLDMINPAIMGPLADNLLIGGSTLTVNIGNDELDSVTDAQLAVRMNAFAITEEVGQFKTANETSSGLYELTDLIRAQLETEEVDHFTNEVFVFLDTSVYFLPLDVSLAGQTIWFRPVTFGTAPENNTAYPFVFMPKFTSPTTIDFLYTEAGDPLTAENDSYFEVES